ncbi:MAG: sugar phosphate isomerase/epimerase [Corallococcus sp.]|nr:sugar phosphate isomerase/epimerase [Corallococcus sp.]
MKLSIRAHDFGVKGCKEVVDELCRYGFDGAQLVSYKVLPDVEYAANAFTHKRAEEVSAEFANADKRIVLVGAYFNPVHSDTQKVARGIDVFRNYLRESNTLGCNIVASETGSYNDDKWTYNPLNRTDDALERVVGVFSELADYARDNNAFIAVEGAFGHVCYDVDRLNLAISKINRDNVKVVFDLYNYLSAENFDDRYKILQYGLETFGNKICAFHLKDCVVQDGNLKQVGVGKGLFDYDVILPMIAKYNPQANLVLEGTVGADIESAVKYIRQRL